MSQTRVSKIPARLRRRRLQRDLERRSRGYWLLAGLSMVALFLFFFDDAVSNRGIDTAHRCFPEVTTKGSTGDAVWAYYDRPNAAPALVEGDVQPIQLALLPEQGTTLHFGRSQAVRALDIDYKLSLQGAAGAVSTQDVESLKQRLGRSPIQLDLLQFRRSDGAALNPDRVRARARVVGDRVRVTLCVDRRDAQRLGGPGSYQGALSIIDPRISRVDLPLVVDAADPNWSRALSLVVLAVLGGSWVTWVVKEQKPETTEFTTHAWAKWSVTAIGLICLVAGAVGAITVFQSSYLNNATWGISVSESIALLTASFVAFMGATTGLHVAGLADKYRRQQTGAEQAGAEQAGAKQAGAKQAGAEQAGAKQAGAKQAGAKRAETE